MQLSPRYLHQATSLQVRSGTGWRTLAKAVTDRNGRVVYTVTPAGRHYLVQYRVVAAAIPGVYGNTVGFAVHVS